jgi:membrane protein
MAGEGDKRGSKGAKQPADHVRLRDLRGADWKRTIGGARRNVSRDHLTLMAAGVAYYGFLALFPAIIAMMMIYGLVTEPAQAESQIATYAAGMPESVRGLIETAARNAASQSAGALSFGVVLSLVVALWSASAGVAGLMEATNLAYAEEETRGFVKKRGTALLLTLGAIVFVLFALALVALLPVILGAVGLGGFLEFLVQVGRWALLVAGVLVALAVLYKVAPDRESPKIYWVSPGAVVATLLWVVASALFSLYMSNVGETSYGETYGPFAGVAILMLWLFITAFVILFGAEINREAENRAALRVRPRHPEAPSPWAGEPAPAD